MTRGTKAPASAKLPELEANYMYVYPDLPLHHWLMLLVYQAQILNGDAGLLQGSRSSVVRASTAKVGGLGFDSQWLPKFFPSVCFYSDLPPVVYQQFLLPVVVIRMATKIVMCGKQLINYARTQQHARQSNR